ncbi:glycosyltransferase [Haloarcula sp. AONF1]
MSRILFLCSRTPYPPFDGARLRVYHTAKILSREYEVDLLIIDESPREDDAIEALESEFSNVRAFTYPKFRFYLNAGRGVFSKWPLQAHYYWFRDVHRWIDNRSHRYDLFFCSHLRTAKYVRGRDVLTAIDLVDAMSRTYERMSSELSGTQRAIYEVEHRRMPAFERRLVDEFDISFITSPVDKKHIEAGWRAAPELSVVPNGVDEKLLKKGPAVSKPSSTIVFLGKMDYFPNEDAVCYFVEEIFPAIRDNIPAATFRIVGMNPTATVRELSEQPGVEVTGFVDQPIDHLIEADVVVAPMRHGAGIQNKILEAMALGKAVVTTPLGAEGIAATAGVHFLVASSSSVFANSTVELLREDNRRSEIGKKAHGRISQQYTWDAVAESLLDPMRELLSQ